MKSKSILLFYSFAILLLLLVLSNTLHISPDEAKIVFSQNYLGRIIGIFLSFFGQSDLSLRLFFVILHIINIWLVYLISLKIVKKEIYALLSAVVYSLLPGVLSSALIVNEAGIVIFLTLLFIYIYQNKKFGKKAYLLFPVMLLADNSFAIFFLSLFFFSLKKKDRLLIFLSLLFFGLSMYLFGFDASGKPRNYFLETFGIYSAVFSPLLFLYFFYTIYRILVKEEKDIVWYISFVSFAFALLLSFRQRIHLEDFAPFAVIALPLMVKVFMNSYKVRIAEHRKKHKLLFAIVAVSLILNDLVLFFNKPLYYLFENPKRHFAYKFHISKPLADSLKKMGIYCVKTSDKTLQKQLRFYGICEKGPFILNKYKINKKAKKVSIRYKNITLETFYVSKINNK
ncbi:glycosyltransferase family 39 protein [Nitrosophilus alvini]|uniref:glycosyltransferase family 39 protein n=1 Tax=Nitrosophilus alvini TaxID=2714855 RepID=UPI00190B32B2|nr:glycosyltransferase family 39 protein [Nitrosophilus alvini]